MATDEDIFSGLLRLADDHLILGQRVSEWCGHAPQLEEDLALSNIALDLIGTARALYQLAGETEGNGRDEDQLAFLRDERAYLNLLLAEYPNTDFAHTILRQFYFSSFQQLYWQAALASALPQLAAIAAKSLKEASYHRRHAADWVIRLGDGTDQSHQRMLAAEANLAPYLAEMFEKDALAGRLAEAAILPDPAELQAPFTEDRAAILSRATLPVADITGSLTGGRSGRHTEAMGHLLAELQYMQHRFPGQQW